MSNSLILPSLFALVLGCAPLTFAADPPAPASLSVTSGQTVVFLGDAFLEREGADGFIETLLTTGLPDGVKFRNLAWSGDTPRCESRSYFDPPAAGFARLRKDLERIKPSVVIACYGAVDAFHGDAGLPDFLASYEKMVTMIREASGAEIVIVSPPPVQTLPPPWPDMAAQQKRLEGFRDALRTFAAERGLRFADILTPLSQVNPATVNGVNLTPEGYRKAAGPVARSLGVEPGPDTEAAFEATAALRKAIIAKNRLFFYRWRPQNEIYLFGSRKHEQGQNSVEIPQFDPLIAKAEAEISALRPPAAKAQP